ncbi:MAG: hypothetical protein ACTSPB_00960 [Candidatus Thorarchaeota archaeon]|jgi:hypothetical protein
MVESSKPKTRMTVTKLGHRIDELADVVDIIHNDMGKIQELLKTLIELQLVTTPSITDDEDWNNRMYN